MRGEPGAEQVVQQSGRVVTESQSAIQAQQLVVQHVWPHEWDVTLEVAEADVREIPTAHPDQHKTDSRSRPALTHDPPCP